MSAARDMQQSERMIRSLAWKGLRRIHALGGHSHTLDDVTQELWCGWCVARDRFDPSLGVPWGAYLKRGLVMHLNRYIEKHFERFHDQTVALSLDYEVSCEDGEASFGELIASTAPTAEEELVRRSTFNRVRARLSPRARFFVEMLEGQPEELLQEVTRVRAKSDYARSRGISGARSNNLTAALIFDLMDASRIERSAILSEIQRLGAIAQRQ